VILVEHRGRVTGLVTVKDCLKYQFKVEAEEQALASTHTAADLPLGAHLNGRQSDSLEENVWRFLQRVGSMLPRWSRLNRDHGPVTLDHREPSRDLSGTEDEDAFVELTERH
jgi:chloride channel 3/4/5